MAWAGQERDPLGGSMAGASGSCPFRLLRTVLDRRDLSHLLSQLLKRYKLPAHHDQVAPRQ
jgi:hypothetical protein